jgi:hypothetical protein
VQAKPMVRGHSRSLATVIVLVFISSVHGVSGFAARTHANWERVVLTLNILRGISQ